MKLKFSNFNLISCDFQILDNLFTLKYFRKVFLVWNIKQFPFDSFNFWFHHITPVCTFDPKLYFTDKSNSVAKPESAFLTETKLYFSLKKWLASWWPLVPCTFPNADDASYLNSGKLVDNVNCTELIIRSNNAILLIGIITDFFKFITKPTGLQQRDNCALCH